MPKKYFCNKVYKAEVYGETDPEQFPTGRYSTCKRCRNRYNNELMQSRKTDTLDSKAFQIDSDTNIRYLIEDTVRRVPLIKDRTIEKSIEMIDNFCTELIDTNYDKWQALEEDTHWARHLETIDRISEFYRINNKQPSHGSKDKEECTFANWISSRKQYKKEGKLEIELESLINERLPWFEWEDSNWERYLEKIDIKLPWVNL